MGLSWVGNPLEEKKMPEQLKPGDVVRLKSGGPAMTVVRLENDSHKGLLVECDWFDGKKRIYDTFSASSLKIAE